MLLLRFKRLFLADFRDSADGFVIINVKNLFNLRENIKNAIIKPNAIDIDNRFS